MSKELGASDENLIHKSDEDKARKLSFFDNTIDESEDEKSVEAPMKVDVMEMEKKEPEMMKPDDSQAGQSGKEKNVLSKDSKSFMEIEVKREKRRWLYMSELGAIFGDEKHTREGFIKIFGTRETLYNIFKLFDVDSNEYLKQDQWIENIKGRLTDERQIDFAEQLESVAYVICGENTVTFDSFVQIWNAKGIIDKFYRLIDPEGTHTVSTTHIIECISNLTNTRPKTGFDKTSLERLEQLFKKTVGEGQEIKQDDFKKIVISKNPFFTQRVFQIFDKDNSGSISLQEFIDAMHQFSGQSTESKIKFLFKVYDLDGDGLIQHEELQHVMRACMDENGMKFSDTQIDDLTRAMFDDADPDKRGAITYEALTNQLTKHGGLLENLSISIDRWLVPCPKEGMKSGHPQLNLPHQLSKPYIKNNSIYLIFVCFFVFINLTLFITRGIQFRKSNFLVIFARACGQCLNFNCAFVLVLMLRQTLTFLRTRGLGAFLPLDQHIYLHKLTGWFIVFFGCWHTLMHLINFSFFVIYDPVINAQNFTLVEFFFTSRPKLFGLVHGWANPTGFLLITILLVMFICSLPFVRRGGSFEVFYWTHLMYIPFWFLVILHGPNFWKWFIIPGCIFIIERLLRFIWMRSDRGKTYVSSGILLPSKVIHLVIKRPFHFCHRPGDYVFINIPQIAQYEWHPFTLSSAPEDEEHIGLHIRAVGQWTNRLLEFFEKEQHRLHSGEVPSYEHQMGHGSDGKHQVIEAYVTNSVCDKVNERSDGIKMKANMIMAHEHDDMKSMMKVPMEKAKSMPNMENRMKTHERLKNLRDNSRSESEKSFDNNKMTQAHLKNLGKAYDSPQNKGIAQSFRYMRNKPTIIAFKTPSLETFEASKNDPKDGTMSESQAAEEGKAHVAVNFPVGKPLEIFIDGPYGAPSSHIFRAQHAVLVGTGIGVTPFASILQSIMNRYYKARHTCPRCEYNWNSEIPPTIMNLRKVDFFWINRDQRSFEWFVNLLSQLEIEQAEMGSTMDRFLDMHMYITSALQKTDMKAVSLQLALDLVADKEKRDLITGLKTRTIAGRPNWDKVFKKIQDQKKGKVTVFYCGPPQLAKTLRFKCEQFGFQFRKEIF